MNKSLSSINTRLTYIEEHTTNAYILNVCRIIREKLVAIKNKKYTTQESVNFVCDDIISNNIAKMQKVAGEAKMVYTKMAELSEFIEQIKEKYFE